jgi:preprotein translocase subunit YajC
MPLLIATSVKDFGFFFILFLFFFVLICTLIYVIMVIVQRRQKKALISSMNRILREASIEPLWDGLQRK